MRELLLIAIISGGLLFTVRYPFVGLLIWAWFTLAAPQQSSYQVLPIPLNLVIAAVTFTSMFFHKEFNQLRFNNLFLLLLMFTFWLIISQQYSLDPENSAKYVDRFVKVMMFVLLCAYVTTNKLRFHALLWIFALVMGFYGSMGGVYTILTLSRSIYFGPEDTILYDNNHMGIALVAALPIFLYLHGQTTSKLVKQGIIVVFILSVLAILGTHSRGAFVSLLVFALFFWIRAKRKLVIALAAMALVAPALLFLPSDWFDRMRTMENVIEDESFMGRVDAWVINTKLAVEHPITGVGLRNSYQEEIARQVEIYREPRAAHSIYFEVLGGTGFVGLIIYLTMLGYAFLKASFAKIQFAHTKINRWRSSFGWHAQISLAAFGVGASTVSMEMWEGYLLLIALISALGRLDQEGIELQFSKSPLRHQRKTAPGTIAKGT